MYNLIKLEIELAQKLYLMGNTQATKTLLSVANLHLKLLTPNFVDPTTSEILQSEITTLLKNL